MGARQLLQSFHAWRAAAEPLVLATVYETARLDLQQGRPPNPARRERRLSRPRQRRLSRGRPRGARARRRRDAGTAAAVTYDLRDAADELWGLGVGCNGCCACFCSRSHGERLSAVRRAGGSALAGTRPAGVATVIESDRADVAVGATAAVADGAAGSACSARATRVRCCRRLRAVPQRSATRHGPRPATAAHSRRSRQTRAHPRRQRRRSLRWRHPLARSR